MSLQRYLTSDGQATPEAIALWGYADALLIQDRLLDQIMTLPELLYLRRRSDRFVLVVQDEPARILIRYPWLDHPFCQLLPCDEVILSQELSCLSL